MSLEERMPPAGAELTAWLRDQLASHGRAHLRRTLTEEEFQAAAAELGPVQMRTDLRVDPRRDAEQRRGGRLHGRPGVFQANELALHADRPTVDVLAWYCVEQDAVDGSLLLVDTADLADHLSPADLAALAEIPVRYSLRHPDSGEEIWYEEPLLRPRSGGGYRVYYAPWQLPADLDPRRARALEAFRDDLERRRREATMAVRLAPGESLFIDNHRLLHGRGALLADSRRHIVRLYVGAIDGTAGAPERP